MSFVYNELDVEPIEVKPATPEKEYVPLGNPNHDKMIRRNMKPIDVEDKRYKKKKRQGETVVLKRFKGYMKGL